MPASISLLVVDWLAVTGLISEVNLNGVYVTTVVDVYVTKAQIFNIYVST